MKVLVVYGGVNNGLKRSLVQKGQNTLGRGESKLTNVRNLNADC